MTWGSSPSSQNRISHLGGKKESEMENGKQVGYPSSSSSSFTNDLFGSKESVHSTASSGSFSSIFPPPSAVLGMRTSVSDQMAYRNKNYMGNPVGNSGIADGSKSKEVGSYCASNKEGNPIFQERSEPCPLSSSLYYGGHEDMYVHSSNVKNPGSYHDVKKGSGEDKNGDDAHVAFRGNWWEGSLYY